MLKNKFYQNYFLSEYHSPILK